MSMNTAIPDSPTTEALYGVNDTDAGLYTSADANGFQIKDADGDVMLDLPSGWSSTSVLVTDLAGTAGTSAAITNAIANPFGRAVILKRAYFYVQTAAGGTSTYDIGIAANAATASDTLFDAANANATGGTITNNFAANNGTNGSEQLLWGPTQFLNVQKSANANANFVGKLIVEVIPL